MSVTVADPGARIDPARNFNFLVEIDGLAPGELHGVQRAWKRRPR